MRHRAASAELELKGQYLGYKLGPMPCYYRSTTEEDPEVYSLTRTSNTAPLHLCHDDRPHSGTISYGVS